MTSTATEAERAIAAELCLRPDPLPVTRLSRKALIALAAVSIVAIVGAVAWAMEDRGAHAAKSELYATDVKSQPDGLAALPKDYATPAGTPKLGPPLPGDLGRPMLAAQTVDANGTAGTASVSAAQQQVLQEADSARTSHLFSGDQGGEGGVGPVTTTMAGGAPDAGATPPATIEDHKTAFLNAPADERTESAERLQTPSSPYVIQAGSVISAALITGIRSDLSGEVVAQVTEDVFDSPSGRSLLIPQGSKLIGLYDSQVQFGQKRVLLAWTRLILPGGRSIVLDRQPAADTQGYAGLQDSVDNHWGQLFTAAILSTILSVGADIGATQNSTDLVEAFRFGAANSLNQTGQQVVGRSLQIQPTLTIRPGFPVRVMVTRDLILEPITK
jgi:type IV secretion system protein VirB10